MRGEIDPQRGLFSYVDLEERIPQDHPIRKIKRVVDRALKALDDDFAGQYSDVGRSSIAPEMLLRAQFLQIFYSIRSERQLVERLDYDLLFRWFVGLGIDDPTWNHSTFSKNRDRVLTSDIAQRLFDEIKKQAYARRLMSRDHFSVDGTLIEASASMTSFVPKDPPAEDNDEQGPKGRNGDVDFKGQKRKNDTHHSTTDSDARLYRKSVGQSAKLCFMGHVLTENRSAMIVDATVTTAGTSKEWDAGLALINKQSKRPGQTVGADKEYDTKRFVEGCRAHGMTPHVAAKASRSSIDGRTTGTASYEVSQRIRKRVEEPFGWMKTVGTLRKTLGQRLEKNLSMMLMNSAAFNVTRMVNSASHW